MTIPLLSMTVITFLMLVLITMTALTMEREHRQNIIPIVIAGGGTIILSAYLLFS